MPGTPGRLTPDRFGFSMPVTYCSNLLVTNEVGLIGGRSKGGSVTGIEKPKRSGDRRPGVPGMVDPPVGRVRAPRGAVRSTLGRGA